MQLLKWIKLKLIFITALAAILGISGCTTTDAESEDDDDTDPDEFEELSLTVCDPETGSFNIDFTNEFFPLTVGRTLTLEGEEEGIPTRLEFTVLDETEVVANVTTRVVTETHYENDIIIELSRNFFAEASDGTVCYFGEEVDNYENGVVINNDGTWLAGEGENLPGIYIPATPTLETQFAQEVAPEVAEDQAAIIGLDESISVPEGDYTGVLHTLDWNLLEGQTSDDGEDKYYAPGVGLIIDNMTELVSITDE